MNQVPFTILRPNGLHLRPAAQLVEQAKSFPCTITLEFEGKKVNAKSIFELQSLELVKGSQGTMTAEGEKEKEAVEKLLPLLTGTLQEGEPA